MVALTTLSYILAVPFMYVDYTKIDGYNCLINMVLGARGCGKSFGAKLKAVKKWEKKRKQFVYLRRTQEELKLVCKTLFADINSSGLVSDEVTYSNGCFLMGGEIIGYAMALSKAGNYKSASYPNVEIMIFDEFLVDEKGRYLKNEPKLLLDIIETVFRMRDEFKVYMLSNSTTLNNPYVITWDLYLNGKNHIIKNDVLFLVLESDKYSFAKSATRLGKLYRNLDSNFADYAIDNRLLFDDNSFIERKSGRLTFVFAFINDGNKYGVWKSLENYRIYISNDIDPDCKLEVTLKGADHTANTQLLRAKKGNVFKDYIIQPFEDGCLRFETKKIKNETMSLFKDYY